jgi:hypothetical protein
VAGTISAHQTGTASENRAVTARASGAGTTNIGGYFTSDTATEANFGVFGATAGTTAGSHYAGNFSASGAVGGNSYGIYSVTTATRTAGYHYGVYAKSITAGAGTRTNVGGYFAASGAENNYGLVVAAGNVGIGTDSPTRNLHIKPASGNAQLQLESDSGSADVELMLDSASSSRNAHVTFYNDGTQVGGIGYVASGTAMKMWGSNNPADNHLVVSSAGLVGIGGVPSSRLHVFGQTQQSVATTTGTDTSTVSHAVDFSLTNLQTVVCHASNDTLTLTGTNYAAGRTVRLFVDVSATIGVTPTFPSSWEWLGAEGTPDGTVNFQVELTSWGATEGAVTAVASISQW